MHWIARRMGGKRQGATVADRRGANRSTPPAEEGAVRLSESLESRQMLSGGVPTVAFQPAVAYDTIQSNTVVAADLNHDGLPDLVTTSEINSVVNVLVNDGSGNFNVAQHLYVYAARSVAVADFNNDGNLDLAVLSPNTNAGGSSSGTNSQVVIFLGNGDGTFNRNPVRINVNYGVNAIAAADLNGDGLPDLIVTTVQRVIVLMNQGNDVFSKPVNYRAGPGNSGQLVVGDFGNGHADVAIVRRNTLGISVLLGNGDGTLAGPDFIRTGTMPVSIAEGDFNGDGKLDLAVANSDFRTSSLDILLGNGDGTFTAKQAYFGGNFVDAIAVGDFNGDGKTDIATASFTSDLRVYAGNGDGTFQPFVDFPSAPYGQYLAAGDLNGDGKTDLALVTGLRLKTLLATTGSAPPVVAPAPVSVPLGTGAARSVTYSDASGSPVTVSLIGPGSATITFASDSLSVNPGGTRVTGGPTTIASIVATGTTAASMLIIKPQGKNGLATVGSISTDGALAELNAPRANLSGDVSIAGTVRSVSLDNVSGGTLTLGSAGAPVEVSVSLATNASLNSAQPISELTAGQWSATSGGSAAISAPAIGRIDVLGQLGANLSAGGIGTIIARGVSGGTWSVPQGNIGFVRVLRTATFTAVARSIGTIFDVNSLAGVNLSADSVGDIHAGTLVDSTLSIASSLGSLTLKRAAGVASFTNDTITGGQLGALNLGIVAFANNGTPQGITAHGVARLIGSDLVTGKQFVLVNPVTLQGLAARGINPADFILQIT